MGSNVRGYIAGLALGLALSASARARGPEPSPSPSYFREGVKALRERDGKEAIEWLSRCVKEEPTRGDCRWELGWARFLEFEFDLALREWKEVQRLDPKREGLSEALRKAEDHHKILRQARRLRSKALKSFHPKARAAKTEASGKGASTERLVVRAVGDIMLGTDFPSSLLPREGESPLSQAGELLRGADIVFGNYEGTLCEGGTSEKCTSSGNCFAFRTPPRLAPLLKEAGFDLISLANNHIADFGDTCRAQTENVLSQLGIAWSGKPGTVGRIERKSKGISLIAFHSAAHSNSTLDLVEASRLVAQEKLQRRIVLVSFHGGAEGFSALHVSDQDEIFYGESRGNVRKFARAMVDAGADLVLGSGPHVPRAMEVRKGRLIAYSLGNFSTYRAFNLSGFAGRGLVLETELDRSGRFLRGKIIPTRQLGQGVPVLDESAAAVDLVRLLSAQDFPGTGVRIGKDGSVGKPRSKAKPPAVAQEAVTRGAKK